jgi:hypothetical protein
VYLTRYHQSGTEAAMLYVANDIHKTHTSHHTATNVILAAPCYSFPGYSFIHSERRPVRLLMTECDPGRGYEWNDAVVRNVDQLVRDSEIETLRGFGVLSSQFNNSITNNSISDSIIYTSVTYLLTFDAYLPTIQSTLDAYHFSDVTTISHTLFRYDYDDEQVKRSVRVFRRVVWSDDRLVGEGRVVVRKQTSKNTVAEDFEA